MPEKMSTRSRAMLGRRDAGVIVGGFSPLHIRMAEQQRDYEHTFGHAVRRMASIRPAPTVESRITR